MTRRPSGSWRSSLGADAVAAQGTRLGEVRCAADSTFWIERRPTEGGRSVIVERLASGERRDRNPTDTNARTRAHEYGGGAYVVDGDAVVFSNFADGAVLRTTAGGGASVLAQRSGTSFADFELDGGRGRIFCVAESERADAEPEATLVALEPGGEIRTLARGHDFFSTPRLSPDGAQLAFLTWEHPRMPWDGTQLWLADVTPDGTLGEPRCVAGGPRESIFQPSWSPDGQLHWVSDRSGWWNLEALTPAGPTPLCPRQAEFGLPQWVFGMTTYGIPRPGLVASAFQENGVWSLGTLWEGELTEIATGMTYLDSVSTHAGPGDARAAMVAASPTVPPHVIEVDLVTGAVTALTEAEPGLDPDHVSTGVPFSFDTTNDAIAHAFFYPPAGAAELPEGERPVALVKSHGGPTAATHNAFDPAIQYWTTRGIAVLDVNYRGSTGFGRAYREELLGNWGVYDVDDCVAAALHLANEGAVDDERLAIRGGSAGGYTTLCALAFRDTFRAGASHYGVGDLETLARDTHKFESRYLDGLIGPYPERRDLYLERSPIHATDQLSCPAIFLQGLDDKIVPPNQANDMVAALDRKGLPVAHLEFEGEGHGFRRAENIIRALEAELYFYSRVFGFAPHGRLPEIPIRNLEG